MRIIRFLFVAIASIGLIGSTASLAQGADAPPFDINVILSMTGSATFVGKAEYDTLSILEATINKQGGIRGRPIHFVIHDDKTDPQTAIQLLNTIISATHPSIVLGSSSNNPCQAIAPLMAATGPVQYCFSPALHPARGSYVFSASVATRDCITAIIRYFRERGWKRIGVLTAIDVGGQDADASLAATMDLPENKMHGVSIVGHEHFNPTDLTVRAQLARISAAKPQAVLLWAAGTPFGTLLRDAAGIGLDLPIATNNANLSDVVMKQYASFLPKVLVLPGLPFLAHQAATKQAAAAQRQFFDAFAAAGRGPDFLDNFAWDPALIVINALRALGTTATAEQLRDYIDKLHDFTGIDGNYDFRDGSQRGLTEKNVMLMSWETATQQWTAVSQLGGMPLR